MHSFSSLIKQKLIWKHNTKKWGVISTTYYKNFKIYHCNTEMPQPVELGYNIKLFGILYILKCKQN